MTTLHKIPATTMGFRKNHRMLIRPHNAITTRSQIVTFEIPPNLTSDLIVRNSRLIARYKVVDEKNKLIAATANVSCINFLGIFAIQKFAVKINGQNCPSGGNTIDPDPLYIHLLTQYPQEDRDTIFRFMGFRQDDVARVEHVEPQLLEDAYCACNACNCLLKVGMETT